MSIGADVLKYLHERPGSVVFLDNMANDLGYEERKVQNAVYRIIGENPTLLRVKVRGRAWEVLKPVPAFDPVVVEADVVSEYPKILVNSQYGKVEPMLFDEIGKNSAGEIIAMDRDNNLYRVLPL